MANNMPKPWIKKTVLNCLDEDRDPLKAAVRCKNILTQVINVFPDLRIVIINDKEHTISVALTEDCVNELDGKDIPLKSLKNCIISLQDWHVSSLIVGAADRDFSRIQQYGISSPLAIQSDRIVLFGADGIAVVGEPRDINRDPDIKKHLNCPHVTFISVLLQNQFPGEHFLPDYRGVFSISAPFSESNPLTEEDTIIPEDQMKALDRQPRKNILSSIGFPVHNTSNSSSSSSSSIVGMTRVEGTQLEATQIDDNQEVEGTQLESTQLDGDLHIDHVNQSQTQLENTQLDPSLEVYGQQTTTGKFAIEFLEGEGEEDHDDDCAVCGEGGNLILCDFCTRVYHKDCASLRRIPRGEWKCPVCTENMTQEENTQVEDTQVENTQVDQPLVGATSSSANLIDEKKSVKTKPNRSFTPRPKSVLELENWAYPNNLVGKYIKKRFGDIGQESYRGQIISYDEENELYLIQYDNGRREEMDEEGAMLYLLDIDIDDTINQQKKFRQEKRGSPHGSNADELKARKSIKTQIMHGFDAHGGIQSSTVEIDQNGVDWLDAILPLDGPASIKKSKALDPNATNGRGISSGRNSNNNSNSNNNKKVANKNMKKQGPKRRQQKASATQPLKKNTKKAPAPQFRRRTTKSRAAKQNVNYKSSRR